MSNRVHILVGPEPQTLSQQLKTRADAVNAPLWLVPTDLHGDSQATRFTFPQLALKLAALSNRQSLLSGPQEQLLFRRVVEELNAKRKLRHLGQTARTPGGLRAVFNFISELKSLGVDAARFSEFAAEAPGKRGIDTEIALIHQSYDDLLATHQYLDRAAVYRQAIDSKRWPSLGDAVFVDGFAMFSAPELQLLARLSQHASDMWLTLPGAEHDDRYSVTGFADTINNLANTDIEYFGAAADERPAGLIHLNRNLFTEESRPANKTDGLTMIEAPGIVGEVRMVARAIKELLLQSPKETVMVAVRRFDAYADLIDETFNEYEIPFAIEGTSPLAREPLVAALLGAAGIASRGFQFSDISTLLRNTMCCPRWPELEADPELPLASDILLRELGEPRGREAFLLAATKWAESPPQPLEDEEEEHSRRANIHEMAKRCLPFLRQFLELWDNAPSKGDFSAHAHWFQEFAERLGFLSDVAELQQLHADIAGWADRERQIAPRRNWTHGEFLNQIQELTQFATQSRTSDDSATVHVLGAHSAAGVACDHLFIVGVGEREFPDLGRDSRLYDETEREAFRGIGLDLEVAMERLPQEKLLFLRLLSNARRSVTLSYPATDDQGQELLPGSFLQLIREDLFAPNAIRTHSQQMLIESLSKQPLSAAEKRIAFAKNGERPSTMSDDQLAHLSAARQVARERFECDEFGPYTGLLNRLPIQKQIAQQFGTARAMSPTSLETYISCPYKFFAGRVLGLTALVEPSDDIATHLRGSAYHRALARLHRDGGQSENQQQILDNELARAVGEYADRAGSKTTKLLWQLELDRLQRSTRNFAAHCERHESYWSKHGTPKPMLLEEKYEVTVEFEGRQMKLRGRIDRVDVLETEEGPVGFVVIDYKTGAGSKFTTNAIQQLRHLQLAVYAVAAENRLGNLQPLGLLYWLPLEKGPKPGLVGKHLAWQPFRKSLESWLLELAENIRAGRFPLQPRFEDSCDYCEYRRLCRIAQGGPERTFDLSPPVLPVVDDE